MAFCFKLNSETLRLKEDTKNTMIEGDAAKLGAQGDRAAMARTTNSSNAAMGKKRNGRKASRGRPAPVLEHLDNGAMVLHRTPRDRALGQLDRAARVNLENTKSPHTRRAYARHWRDFEHWCQEMGLQAMPARASDIVRYLNHLEIQGRSIATIRLARSALVHAFRLWGIRDHENPGRDGVVSETLKGMSTRSKPQKQAAALLPESLNAIRATAMLPRERSNGGRPEAKERAILRGRIDIALCLLLRDAGLRRSEAAAITWEDVEDWPDGSGRLRILRSKTNRTGEPEVVAITPAGMAALEVIRPEEPLPGQSVFGLSERQISRRIKDAAESAGLGEGYSGHSGRVGLARTMTDNGAPVNVTMKQGRWRRAETVARYTRGESAGAALRWIR